MSHKYNQQIQGLRGIACMVVALHHLVCSYSYRYLERSWAVAVKGYTCLGQWGVAVFFCISVWFLIDKSNDTESNNNSGNPIK